MSPAEVQSAYVYALASANGPGTLLTLIRGGNPWPLAVHGWVTEFVPTELAGGVQQGKRKAILLASDVVASKFPLPFKAQQDRIRWTTPIGGPKTNVIMRVDDATVSIQGVLVAYRLELDGA